MTGTRETCANCGEPYRGDYSLPVDSNGDFVAVDFAGEWAGVPSCKQCHDIHKAAGSSGPAVLKAFELAAEELHATLEHARNALESIRSATQAALNVVGEQ